jgi:hypothetical protein
MLKHQGAPRIGGMTHMEYLVFPAMKAWMSSDGMSFGEMLVSAGGSNVPPDPRVRSIQGGAITHSTDFRNSNPNWSVLPAVKSNPTSDMERYS